tara:strand:- start:778 stop:1191 length:414 start_codon:yes stop_codon:yes gene_type:complete
MIPVYVTDSNGREVAVGEGGALTVSPVFDEVAFNELAVADQAYNYYTPLAGSKFILTGVVATADSSVVGDATVIIYEASAPDSTTVDNVLFQFVLLKNQQLVIPNFQIKVTPNVWINGKTNDDDIHMSVIGHFVKGG